MDYQSTRGAIFADEAEAILREERELAETMLRLLRSDSRFGYEASNHYLYTENDFLEKIINCDHLSV